MIEVDAHVRWRELILVFGRKAFGDASETDAESVSRHFFVRLGKFNARRCKISSFRRLIK